jgi:hypothetical protein
MNGAGVVMSGARSFGAAAHGCEEARQTAPGGKRSNRPADHERVTSRLLSTGRGVLSLLTSL